MTKSELELKVKILEEQLVKEQSRPTGHTISNVDISMTPEDANIIAIAGAVKEAMKALQQLKVDSRTGIFLEAPKHNNGIEVGDCIEFDGEKYTCTGKGSL